MTTDEELEDFEDEPDCGVDAASDEGYWLENTDQRTSDYLISWRKEVGLSPELLSQMAPIPLEEYLLIEKGERTMTNGDAWRIDDAIIKYLVSKQTWFQRSWKRGWLFRCRRKLRLMWESDVFWQIISLAAAIVLYHGFLREYILYSEDILAYFLRSAFLQGIPMCFMVWLALRIIKEPGETE